MTTTTTLQPTDTTQPTPTSRLLDGSLAVAPLLYLAADTTYAVRGWDDPTAGVLHVVAALGYGFVVLAVAGWLPRSSRLAAAIVFTGVLGAGGNLAYGFDTIHLSLGDVALVDQPGAANLIKPLGLFFPLSFALVAAALARLGHRWQAVLVLVAIRGVAGGAHRQHRCGRGAGQRAAGGRLRQPALGPPRPRPPAAAPVVAPVVRIKFLVPSDSEQKFDTDYPEGASR